MDRRIGAGALLLLAVAGCDAILGLERRTYTAPGETPCVDSLACSPGSFCNAGACTATPPESPDCQLLEPAELADLGSFDWSKSHHVVGALFRRKNAGEMPRLDAMRLAIRQINGNGGIPSSKSSSRPAALVVCDFGGADGLATSPQADVAIKSGVEYLATGLGARVILAGIASTATKTAISHILDKNLPVALVSSFSTSPALTNFPDRIDHGKYGLLWRTAPDDLAQTDVLARLIDAEPGLTKVAVLYIDDDYGTPFQEALGVRLAALPKKLPVATVPFAPTDGQAELGQKIATLLAEPSPPDALLIVGIDGARPIAAYQALVAGGKADAFKAYFLADAAKDAAALLDPKLPAEVLAIVGKAKGTAPYRSTAQHYDTFANALSAAFGTKANDYSFMAQSYDAAFLAGYGLTWANADGVAFDGTDVVEGFANLAAGDDIKVGASTWAKAAGILGDASKPARSVNLDGTSGPLEFDPETGQTGGPMEVWRVVGGAFQTCAVCDSAAKDCNLAGCASP